MKEADTGRIRRAHRRPDDGDAARHDRTRIGSRTPGPGRRENTSGGGRSYSPCAGKHRLERLGPPLVDYTPEETRIWREVSPKLDELHLKHASSIYLKAKRDLAITRDEIPQLRHLSDVLQRETNMHLVPAEGALPYRTFYEYIAERGFPVTQFIRHGSHPEFTPEPDMIHDCLGHVPPLMNRDYAELLTLIGKAVGHVHARRRGAGPEAFQLVQHRVRPDRGRRARSRCSAPASCPRPARFPILCPSARSDAPAVRDGRGHRDRLRPVADAGPSVHRSVAAVSAPGAGESGAAVWDPGVYEPRSA